MALEHCIYTGRNGRLDGTTREQVAAMVAAATEEPQDGSPPRVVIHLHGGLVSRKSGEETAERLTPVYTSAGATPIFMVWESGAGETLLHNLDEIFAEDLFKSLLRRLLQFTVGKVWQEDGQRAAGVVPTPKLLDVEAELARRSTGGEPYAEEDATSSVDELVDSEEAQFTLLVQADPDGRAAVEQVVAGRHPEEAETDEGSRGVVVRRRASTASLIDPDVLEKLDPGAAVAGERGLVTTVALARKAARALARVISRFAHHDDHGIYPTVVEELLREFYLANAGGALWAAMKKETGDTFEDDGGGRLLLDELGRALAAGSRPEITLVGHSTGAVYIDNLLDEVLRGRQEGYRPWPDDVRFRVVLLAPAATYGHFQAALGRTEELISHFRMFTMADAAERADHLLGPLYPRSLLYLVSGLVERGDDGQSALVPVLGLSRYRDAVYADRKALAVGRAWLLDDRVVLSPSGADAPEGRRAAALKHGDFDNDSLVLESVVHLVRGGS